jgi:Beta-galactosidase
MRNVKAALFGLAAVLATLVAAQPAQAGSFHGVVAQGELGTADFDRMGQAHVGLLRVTVPWNRIQPARGAPLDTAWLDAIVQGAAAEGVRVMLTLSGPGPTRGFTPPTTGAARSAYANVLRQLAERYGRGGSLGQVLPVTTYQIYNEQNGFYWGERPSPGKYARLVKAAGKQLQRADRSAEVVLGGMFGTPSARGGITSWAFLGRLYRTRGIERSFNTVAIHPYASGRRGITYQLKKVRLVLKRNHDKGTKLRITEIGYGSAGGGHPLNKGLQGQARALRNAVKLLERNKRKYKISGFNWFSWQDNPGGGCAFCPSSGLLRADETPKPSYSAFSQVAG